MAGGLSGRGPGPIHWHRAPGDERSALSDPVGTRVAGSDLPCTLELLEGWSGLRRSITKKRINPPPPKKKALSLLIFMQHVMFWELYPGSV